MRKIYHTLVLCLLCLSVLRIGAQSISRFEYFIDTDPGMGNATPFLPAPADSVSVNIAVDLSSLSTGFHHIGIRSLDNAGHWSFPELRTIYIQPLISASTQNLSRFEYFIDTDPGMGNGINFIPSPADSVSVNIVVNVNSMSPGFHHIGIRSMDNAGHWCLPEFRNLYVEAVPPNTNSIVAAEYYLGDTPPAFGAGKSIIVNNPGDSISITADTILNNLPLGQYKLHMRVKNARGEWSHQETRLFTVCSAYGAQSEMTYQVEGNRVYFTNNSLYFDTVTWKFGDNTLDTLLNPVKTYTTTGIYTVQLITGNSCGIDTLTQPIEIRGLQRVNANRAGNAGISTLVFEGFGFTTSTDVKLIVGNTVINPVSKTFVSSFRIRANFDLTGFPPAACKAVATLGSGFDTLSNAVTIEADEPAIISLSTNAGRMVQKPSRVVIESYLDNTGSQDAVMAPYMITSTLLPGTADVNNHFFLNSDMVFLANKGVFQHTLQYISDHGVPAEVMAPIDNDTARKRAIIAYYNVRIPAHSSVLERVRDPHTVTYSYQTAERIMPQLLDSYALIDTIHSDYSACYSSFLKHGVEKELNITIANSGWSNCFTSAFDTLMRTLAHISQDPSLEKFAVPMQAGFSALLAKMADCSGSGIPANLGGIQFKRIIQGVMHNWAYLDDVDSISADCIDTSFHFIAGRNAGTNQSSTGRITEGGNCSQCPGALVFPEMCDQCLPILQAAKIGGKLKIKASAFSANSAIKGCKEWCENNSVDPNSKYGPGNNDDRKYINTTAKTGYRITFENVATATAPAAFVEISDTLDKSVLDIRTLSLGVFSWGDSLIEADPNEQNVSILKTLKPTYPNFLRIDATTDTAAGIVRWRFWTVDTVTLQLTTDPTQGFLPPNTDGVSGAGYVTFFIKPLSTVTNGTIIRNKASIVFDDNAPLITNEWEHRIDTLPPTSAVDALPPVTPGTSFTVSWAGSDAHSGIDRFNIYVSVNDSTYKIWQTMVSALSATFTGQLGNTYKFISIAVDKAGNLEDPPFDPLNNPDAVTTIQAPLPLNLLSFTAQKTTDGKKVNLDWVTTNEINVASFELQRSADGSAYATIATIPAKNNINGAVYSWQDIAPLPKNNYYRLRIRDIDASFKFSPVRLITMGKQDDIFVFPTLTRDVVFVQSAEKIVFTLFNVQGTRLEQKTIQGSMTFDLRSLPAGIYFIRAQNLDKTYKIIKE